VNTPKVNILLSTDGGLTFPYVLGNDIDNNGSYTFTVPLTGEGDTTLARIIVEGKDNIFFAMNAANFTIKESEFALAVSNPELDVCAPDEAVYNFTYNTFLGFTDTTTFSTNGLPSGATATFSPTTATADGTAVTAIITGIESVAAGQYSFTIIGVSGAITKESDVFLGIYNGSPESITLTAPTDGNTGVSLTSILTWDADANAASYDVEVATDNTFATIVSSGNVATNSYNLAGLELTTTYYWRVKGKSICGDGEFSSTFSFTTISCTACTSVGNTTYETSTTLVKFNTIDNISAKPSGYSDYTAIATTVKRGDAHEITINVNTDGNYTVHTVVWIDWNHDCDFLDTGENYDLGDAINDPDGATTLSPLTITVPEGASIGSTIMRVSTKYSTDPASCSDTTFDGEVEDYTVTVEEATATIEDFAFSGFNLYPNPSKGAFNLNFDVVNTEKVSVQLFDIRGRLIGENNFIDTNTKFSERISFQRAAAGLYLVKIINGNKRTTRKLVIE
jgi:hypothetical protein